MKKLKNHPTAKKTHIPRNTNDTVKTWIDQASMTKEEKKRNTYCEQICRTWTDKDRCLP